MSNTNPALLAAVRAKLAEMEKARCLRPDDCEYAVELPLALAALRGVVDSYPGWSSFSDAGQILAIIARALGLLNDAGLTAEGRRLAGVRDE